MGDIFRELQSEICLQMNHLLACSVHKQDWVFSPTWWEHLLSGHSTINRVLLVTSWPTQLTTVTLKKKILKSFSSKKLGCNALVGIGTVWIRFSVYSEILILLISSPHPFLFLMMIGRSFMTGHFGLNFTLVVGGWVVNGMFSTMTW